MQTLTWLSWEPSAFGQVLREKCLLEVRILIHLICHWIAYHSKRRSVNLHKSLKINQMHNKSIREWKNASHSGPVQCLSGVRSSQLIAATINHWVQGVHSTPHARSSTLSLSVTESNSEPRKSPMAGGTHTRVTPPLPQASLLVIGPVPRLIRWRCYGWG